VGFGAFAPLPEEQISEKISRRIHSGDQGMVVWWSIGAGVHVEPHSHANEQIVWMLKGKMEFRLGSKQRICGQGDVIVREDTEVIDFFAPPSAHRDALILSRARRAVARSPMSSVQRQGGRVVLVFAVRTKPPSLAPASILLPKPSVMEAGHRLTLRSDEI
jgi:hypothetical protein